MNESVLTRSVVVRNPQGIHARPADSFSKLARQFEAEIHIQKGTYRVDAKSVLNVMTLAAEAGTRLVIEARGKDAASALEALAAFVESDFEHQETAHQGQSG